MKSEKLATIIFMAGIGIGSIMALNSIAPKDTPKETKDYQPNLFEAILPPEFDKNYLKRGEYNGRLV